MMRPVKIAVITSALLGIMSGAFLGVSTRKTLSGPLRDTQFILVGEVLSDFAARQFQNADTAHAREATLLEIRFLKQLQQLKAKLGEEQTLAFAYARLAMIEEAGGQKASERAALIEARGWLRRSHPSEELTDEQLRNTVERLDQARLRAGGPGLSY